MLRDANEAFREGHRRGNVRAAVASLRAASTRRGRVDAEERGVILDGGGPSPASPRSSVVRGGSSSSSGGGKVGGALGLKEFMHRTRVLDLYRGILKVGEIMRMPCLFALCVYPLPFVSGCPVNSKDFSALMFCTTKWRYTVVSYGKHS